MIRSLGSTPSTFNPHPSIIRTTQAQQIQQVSLPHLFTPRPYQEQDLFRQLFPHHYEDLRLLGIQPKKRILLLWHRRAGKDLSSISALAIAAHERVGNYLYLLPEQTQAKKVIWRGIDKEGIKFLARIPEQIVKRVYESEMLIELKNESTIQLGGSDNYNSWMGTNPLGIINSEYSLQDPMAWTYFRPILRENGGWAVFIYTARGKNHGYDLYQTALSNPKTWHCSKKTIEDTTNHDGSPIITIEGYQEEIRDGMQENFARQEFYCDFDAALIGAFYGELMTDARLDGRIGYFPHDPAKPVYTFWDVGLDANAVGFFQASEGGDPRFIDYEERKDEKFSTMCKIVLEKPYLYRGHYVPHDFAHRDAEKRSVRKETADKYGLEMIETEKGDRTDGIEAVKQIIPRVQFHEDSQTDRALDALCSYHRKYDEELKIYRDTPVHDWSSHCADMFRNMAVNWTENLYDDSWFNDELEVDNSGIR